MPLKIKPINHGTTKADRNRYCGPSVISAITGMTTGEAARLIRHVGGRKSIKGSSTWEVKRSLDLCGIESKRTTFGLTLGRSKGVTLAGWLKGTVKERTADRVFLIVAGWHWQLVQGRRYVCGIVGDVVSIKDKKIKRRARVAEVYELTSMGAITTPSEAMKPKQTTNNFRGKAQRLAKKMGMEISIERTGYGDNSYWIDYEGEDDYVDLGVIEGHCSYDWYEVLDKLEEIEQHQQQKQAA
ncbi:hypothetical protein OAU55_00225 [Candidatus Pelagibacter sp.]|nr:hypothetical protein [Candidatus Pelagibacter sp.]